MTATLDAFRSSLQRGSGRAMLILRDDPADPDLLAALFHSCTVNEVFDPQCEAARAAYLRRLILATGQADAFRRDLAAHLASAGVAAEAEEPEAGEGASLQEAASDDLRPDDLRPKDLGQTFELLCLLAADEPSFDRRVLWDFLARTDFDTACFGCADALVRLDGLPALLHCVERFPADFANAPYELDGLVHELRERDGETAANEALDAARRTSAALGLLLSLVREDDGPWSPQSEGPVDYQSIKAQATPEGGLPFPVHWGKRASSADVLLAAGDLLAETDDSRRLSLLRAFLHVGFPLDPEPLFALLDSPVRQVRVQTVNVLGRMRHPAVRRLALENISGARIVDRRRLRLLVGSAQPGDSELFGPLLASVADDGDVVHWIFGDILDIIENGSLPLDEGVPWLVRVYEETPCSNCRQEAVVQLNALGRVPAWMAAEWPFDVDADLLALTEAAA